MFRELLTQLSGYSFLDWFQLVGATIAFILTVLTLLEYRKKRVALKIELKQKEFKSRIVHDYDETPLTEIDIEVDIRNRGLEPTTIVGVDFFSDYEELNKLDMATRVNHRQFGVTTNFDEIRIDQNDRRKFSLHIFNNHVIPENIQELNAKLIFKTTHKDIKRKIILKREEEITH